MLNRSTLYRSTLVAAAVAIGCFGAAGAEAHEHGWRGHEGERAGYGRDHGWHEHGWHEHDWHDHDWREREWRERGWRRAYGPRVGYVAPLLPGGWAPVPPLPPVAFYPPAPVAYVPGGLTVAIRVPF